MEEKGRGGGEPMSNRVCSLTRNERKRRRRRGTGDE